MNFNRILGELTKLRTSFGPEFSDRKQSLLQTLTKFRKPNIKQLMQYHELLLFMMAYPDSLGVYQTTIKELHRISKVLRTVSLNKNAATRIEETGMAHTSVTVPPSLNGCEWLIDTLGKAVAPVWDSELIEKIGPQLSLFALPSEMDGLTNNNFDALDWMRIKAGDEKNKQPHLLLKWLIISIKTAFPDQQQQDQFWEQLSVSTLVKLNEQGLSRTLNFLETQNPFIQNSSLIRSIDVQSYINQSDCVISQPNALRSNAVINSGRAALLARGRETDPVTYAEKITEVNVGRGLTVYLFTMRPERRLPLENYTGFVAYRNGVPVGYGGGWIFGFRCEIGVNIFETFRGGENYLLFAGIMKAYNAVFNVKRFSVAPYQFGEDNHEGIQTGAYWFYYKLGFRSANKEIAAIAEKEVLKMKKNKNYRSSEKTLLKFTESPLYFNNGQNYSITEPNVLGICISRWITSKFSGDHKAALNYSINYISNKLPAGFAKKWRKEEKQSFKSLAPLIAMTQCLDTMNEQAAIEIAEMMRQKGNDEIKHSVLLQNNYPLISAFKDSAKKYVR